MPVGTLSAERRPENSVWSKKSWRNNLLALLSLIIVGTGAVMLTRAARSGPARSQRSLAPAPTTGSVSVRAVSSTPELFPNLEDTAAQWGIFFDGGSAQAQLDNVAQPSKDGRALKISLLGGQHTGIHVYRNLPANTSATLFGLSLSFSFSSLPPMQAQEFCISRWVKNQRWEWALQ